MFRKLMKNKKAQNTAEYAILISLVVAGIIAMQTYAQRALQARVRDAGQYLTDQTNGIGSEYQYEPYYLTTNYEVSRNQTTSQYQYAGQQMGGVSTQETTNRQRTGSQTSTYSGFGLLNGI